MFVDCVVVDADGCDDLETAENFPCRDQAGLQKTVVVETCVNRQKANKE